MRLLTVVALAAMSLLLVESVGAQAVSAPRPLPAEQQQVLAGIRSDPAPESLIRSSHYWVSNEASLHLFYEPVLDRGGALLGVGTDQNYLLAGWAKSELLILLDFDLAITHLHRVYQELFRRAETPQAFVDAWDPKRKTATRAWLAEAYAGHPDLKAIRKAHHVAAKRVWGRLLRLRRKFGKRGIGTFVDDAAQYAWVRRLWSGGRVVTVRGDLTADLSMLDAAAALRRVGVPLRVLYLSNTEQYFDYGPTYRRNILNLPTDDRTLVVHTLGWRGPGMYDNDYHYSYQTADSYKNWMRHARTKKFGHMLRHRVSTNLRGFSRVEGFPERLRGTPEIAPMP